MRRTEVVVVVDQTLLYKLRMAAEAERVMAEILRMRFLWEVTPYPILDLEVAAVLFTTTQEERVDQVC
jgi:hypothetical protein